MAFRKRVSIGSSVSHFLQCRAFVHVQTAARNILRRREHCKKRASAPGAKSAVDGSIRALLDIAPLLLEAAFSSSFAHELVRPRELGPSRPRNDRLDRVNDGRQKMPAFAKTAAYDIPTKLPTLRSCEARHRSGPLHVFRRPDSSVSARPHGLGSSPAPAESRRSLGRMSLFMSLDILVPSLFLDQVDQHLERLGVRVLRTEALRAVDEVDPARLQHQIAAVSCGVERLSSFNCAMVRKHRTSPANWVNTKGSPGIGRSSGRA